MSTADYPSFYTLNQPEPESLSIIDQAVNPYPSMDEAAYDNLVVNRFFDQFLNLTAQYNDLPSLPALNIPSDIKQMFTLEQSTPPTRQLTGPVRLKHTHPRVLHACDYCRHRKTKVRSYYHIFLHSLTPRCSVLGSSQYVRVARKGEGHAPGHP